MNINEYKLMSNVESIHWWYKGLSHILQLTCRKFLTQKVDNPNILDVGCGTGNNLLLLQKWLNPGYLGGFDFSDEALKHTFDKVPDCDIYQSDICKPEIHRDDLDLIISMDVLNVPGTKKALPGLIELVAHLKPGGFLVMNLPAYQFMFSEHDVAVHSTQRFTLSQTKKLFSELGLETRLASYRVSILFPLILIARLPSIISNKPPREDSISDLKIPFKPVNRILEFILKFEHFLISKGIVLPFGSSIYIVGQKPLKNKRH